jgi:hypothetical protein
MAIPSGLLSKSGIALAGLAAGTTTGIIKIACDQHYEMRVLHHEATNQHYREFALRENKIEKTPQPQFKKCEYIPVDNGKDKFIKKVCVTSYTFVKPLFENEWTEPPP